MSTIQTRNSYVLIVLSDRGAMGYVNGETIVDISAKRAQGRKALESFEISGDHSRSVVWWSCSLESPLTNHQNFHLNILPLQGPGGLAV